MSFILGFALYFRANVYTFPDNLTGFNSVADGVCKCAPYQLYVYMQLKTWAAACVTNGLQCQLILHVPVSDSQYTVCGPLFSHLSFRFQKYIGLISTKLQNRKQRFSSKNQSFPSLALHNIFTPMFHVQTFIDGVSENGEEGFGSKT